MSCQILNDNLREIYSSIKNGHELTPNSSGNRFYDASVGLGRIWKWYFCLAGFFSRNIKERKFAEAARKTAAAFESELERVRQHSQQFHAYIRKQSLGRKKIDESHLPYLRREIIKWQFNVMPFFKKTTPEERLATKLPFLENIPVWKPKSHAIIELEASLKDSLPFLILKKLSCDEKLTSSEKKELSGFIEKLHQSNIRINLFQKVLKQLVIQFGEEADLALLAVKILESECKLFYQQDPKMVKWRSSLRSGDFVGERRIEERIDVEKPLDRQFVYSVQGDPTQVIAIADNKITLLLREKLKERIGWAVRHAECKEMHPNGKYAVFERLVAPVKDYQWKTREGDPFLLPEDQETAKPIANLLQWIYRHPVIPSILSADRIMFSRDGILKTYKLSFPENFDFCEMERFVFECANGNLAVFQFLMRESKLNTSNESDYFKEILESTLNRKEINFIDEAAIRNIIRRTTIEEGKRFAKEVRKFRTKCLKKFKRLEKLDESILSCYSDTLAVRILWPDLERRVGIYLDRT